MQAHRAIGSPHLSNSLAIKNPGRDCGNVIAVGQPSRDGGIVGKRLCCARDDMLGSHFLQIEKGHQSSGGHPQKHLKADEDRQPFVQLAAQDMQAQSERALRHPVGPSHSDQRLRGARDEE